MTASSLASPHEQSAREPSARAWRGRGFILGLLAAGVSLSVMETARAAYIGADAVEPASLLGSNAGDFDLDGVITIGRDATGALTVNDSSQVTATQGSNIGRNSGGNGTLTVDGPGSLFQLKGTQTNGNGAFFNIGAGGTATVTVSGGGVVEQIGEGPNSAMNIGGSGATSFGGTATVTVTGTGSRLTVRSDGADLNVGRSATGTLRILNGATAEADNTDVNDANFAFGGLRVGTRENAAFATHGTVEIDGTGSTLTVNGAIDSSWLGRFGGTGEMTVSNGGTLDINGEDTLFWVARDGGSTGNLTVTSGGTVDVSGTVDSDILIGFASGGGTGGTGTVTVNGANSLLKAGDAVAVGAPTSFGGGTSSGTLNVSNGGTVEAVSVYVGNGGVLSGNGTVNADLVLDGGTINPGNSPGTLRINGHFTYMGGTIILEVEEDGLGGFVTDRLLFDTGATPTLLGADIAFVFLGETDPEAFAASGLFNLSTFLRADDGAGGDDPLGALGTLLAGATYSATAQNYSISNFAFDTTVGVQSLVATGIPEPGTLALFTVGLWGLGVMRRRHRAAGRSSAQG